MLKHYLIILFKYCLEFIIQNTIKLNLAHIVCNSYNNADVNFKLCFLQRTHFPSHSHTYLETISLYAIKIIIAAYLLCYFFYLSHIGNQCAAYSSCMRRHSINTLKK